MATKDTLCKFNVFEGNRSTKSDDIGPYVDIRGTRYYIPKRHPLNPGAGKSVSVSYRLNAEGGNPRSVLAVLGSGKQATLVRCWHIERES